VLIRALVLTLLAASLTLAAPAPPHRPKPPAIPTPGSWVLTWEQAGGRITLAPNGAYHCRWGASDWYGSWAWDTRTRTLHVHETSDGQSWLSWHVQFDDRLSGEALIGARRIRVSLTRPGK
jgi:hypothetical protein